MMQNKYIRFFIVTLVLLLCILYQCSQLPTAQTKPPVIRHTIVIPVKNIVLDTISDKNTAQPVTIKKQIKKDKKRRRNIINKIDTTAVIELARMWKGELTITKIDSSGAVEQSVYETKPTDQIKIDETGKVEIIPDLEAEKKQEKKERRKKFWNKVQAVVILSGVISITIIKFLL